MLRKSYSKQLIMSSPNSHRNAIKIGVGILAGIISISIVGGAITAYANTDLTTQYNTLLAKNEYLISQSLLTEEIHQSLKTNNPKINGWIENLQNYSRIKQSLNQAKQDSEALYQQYIQTEKLELETKIALTYQFLKDNPNSKAKPMLENTLQTVEKYIQSPTTPLEKIQEGNTLLSENNTYFASVLAVEKKEAYKVKLAQTIEKASEVNNQTALVNGFLSSDTQSLLNELTGKQKQIESMEDLAQGIESLESELNQTNEKLTVITVSIESEKARLAEAERIRIEQERLAAEEAAKYAKANGITYKNILVDISDQMSYYYEGQTLVNSTPVVTGRPQYPTPPGTYAIYAKARNISANGCADGVCWNTPLNYWMPFYNPYGLAYGLHDAYWQPYFGGNRRFENNGEAGSHGCVNLPPAFAEWLYSWSEIGTTVQIVP
jgi:lipoprotein-anchoring transpeptidase ErfK/SrfK